MRTKSAKNKAMLLMAICAVLWSLGGIFIKLISWHPLLIAGGVCCVLSLVGVFAPKKMKWLMDAWKKKNGG